MGAPGRVDDGLSWARQAGVERLDARVLLGHVLGRTAAWILAHGDDELPEAARAAFESLCQARLRGTPISYLVGHREFHGLSLEITPAVLDPRPDTETLVDWALACLAGRAGAAPRVLDLGTGSGAIALAIRSRCPQACVWATDRSDAALAVARRNAERLALAVTFRHGSWFDALAPQDGPFDLIVSNPPYIAARDPHLLQLAAEPREALVAGDDGLADLALLAREGPRRLADGGWLLLEHGHEQADAVCARLAAAGLGEVQSRRDLAGHRRCSGGRRTAATIGARADAP